MADADRKSLLPKLREKSRQKYLGERKDKKIEELEGEIMDEETIFSDKLTSYERERLEYKRKLLQLAKEHEALDSKMKVETYYIPKQYVNEKEQTWDHAAQAAVLNQRYEEAPIDEFEMNWEQKNWENEQMKSAVLKSGWCPIRND